MVKNRNLKNTFVLIGFLVGIIVMLVAIRFLLKAA